MLVSVRTGGCTAALLRVFDPAFRSVAAPEAITSISDQGFLREKCAPRSTSPHQKSPTHTAAHPHHRPTHATTSFDAPFPTHPHLSLSAPPNSPFSFSVMAPSSSSALPIQDVREDKNTNRGVKSPRGMLLSRGTQLDYSRPHLGQTVTTRTDGARPSPIPARAASGRPAQSSATSFASSSAHLQAPKTPELGPDVGGPAQGSHSTDGLAVLSIVQNIIDDEAGAVHCSWVDVVSSRVVNMLIGAAGVEDGDVVVVREDVHPARCGCWA